ncbi:MAG: polyphosphate kinase 2 family protein [Sandaracinaceae bacterium]|nr:MAG: polyphosphate kinase 2 family protein [Sandaracinaceae bacterium]HBQ13671.1 phosphate--nucleotide phosphotransferase [Myxococcales bacterium]
MSERYLEPIDSPYRVHFDGSFRVAKTDTGPPEDDQGKKKKHKKALKDCIERMRDLQRAMYADDSWSLLLVFQAMDAAGKDGTIRAVMSGVNPAGCQVYSFKKPSDEELDHDFLWRINRRLPERGRIGIFNRSHYEEVLAVRVHPEYLEAQKLPGKFDLEQLWKDRFESIRAFERHLARSGTVILKFWLNVSKEEQRSRFLDRIDEPESNWKFNPGDISERGHWDSYMEAYEDALNQTSRPWAPWFSIPADEKPYMRLKVAEIIVETLEKMAPKYPEVNDEVRKRLMAYREQLASE